MSLARRTVEEYTALLSRAFNGAIEVDGQRIVAHPSGTLLARGPRAEKPVGQVIYQADPSDRDNDWSNV